VDTSVILPELPTYLFAPSIVGLLSLLLTAVLPLLAGLLMKQSWSAAQKGTVLLILAAVKTYAEAWLAAADAGLAFNHVTTIYAIVVNFGIAVASYFGLLKGTAVQQAAITHGVKDSRTIDGTYTDRRH
jgi:hypothetical protein